MKFVDDVTKENVKVKCNTNNEWTTTADQAIDWTLSEFKCQPGAYFR